MLLLFWGFSAILGVVGRISAAAPAYSRTTAVEVAIKQGSNSHVSIGKKERERESESACMHTYARQISTGTENFSRRENVALRCFS